MAGTPSESTGDSFTSIEWVFGSDFRDEIEGDDTSNRLEGRGGAMTTCSVQAVMIDCWAVMVMISSSARVVEMSLMVAVTSIRYLILPPALV